MIQSFANKLTEDVFHGIQSHTVRAQFSLDLVKLAERKLDLLNGSNGLEELMALPLHRNDRSGRDSHGKYVIPINEQWNVAFRWTKDGIEEVEIKAA